VLKTGPQGQFVPAVRSEGGGLPWTGAPDPPSVRFDEGIGRRFRKWNRLSDGGKEKFPVQLGNEMDADRFRTDCFAFILVTAGSEPLTIHRSDHGLGALMPFRFALWQRGK